MVLECDTEDVTLVEFAYFVILYLLACQVTVILYHSGVCCSFSLSSACGIDQPVPYNSLCLLS